MVLDAYVTITNTVTTMDAAVLPQFTFALNSGTTNLLNSLAPPGNWTGFGASVNPFTPPTLGPNEIFKLWFDYEVPVPSIGASLSAPLRVAAGSTDPRDNLPHPVAFINVAPEPASPALLILGAIAFLVFARTQRRRKTFSPPGSSEAKG